jgi:catechol 2,3-dioxygenase-like lactoylglutathione lyase family enzyme
MGDQAMSTSVDHVGISVSDYDRAKAFYVAALQPLNLKVLGDYGVTFGMGEDYPFLWISAGDPGHAHLALRADNRAMVDAFYDAAIKAGGTDNGKPGVRSEYSENYYAAYVLDADGHNIEAVTYGK